MHLSKTGGSLIPFQAIVSETCMFSLWLSRFHLVCLGRENRQVWVSSVGDLQPVQAVFLEHWLLGLTSAFQLRMILAVLMGKIAPQIQMDVYIVVRLDLLRCDQSSAVHRDPGEIDWRKCRSRSSYNLAPSLHSSLPRQVGSTTILERLLWWHPRHEQWHASMITSSAFKVSGFFYYLKKNLSIVSQ